MKPAQLIGLAISSYVALVIFRSLQSGTVTFNVNPTDAAFLAVANIGAAFAVQQFI